MAQLVHFHNPTATEIVEFVIIDDEDLSPEKLKEKYGEPGFEICAVVTIIGDVTSFPAGRELTSSI